MRQADAILQDEALLQLVYEALGQRAPKSKTRGRRGTPAEQVLRLLVLKHVRDGVSRWWCARCGPTWSIASSRG
jgi:IS5 family transposase